MRALVRSIAALVCLTTTVAAQDPPRRVFRSAASAVAVDVTVRDRTRRSVTGLAAADFHIYDNGVLQQVDAVSYGKVPIDVTIALDVSYSVTGALLERLRRGVVQLMRDLGREDRLRLLLFNMRVTRVTPFTRDVKLVEESLRAASAGGGTALYDAVSVALVSASAAAADRRHLVVFFTDGNDSSSATTPETLSAVAQRTRATLTFVMPATTSAPLFILYGVPGKNMTPPPTTVRLTPVFPAHAVFSRLAAETGGALLPVGPSSDLSATFRTVLSDFRSAYVLYFTPRGVDGAGYHTIEVKTSRDGAVVQARRGYFGS